MNEAKLAELKASLADMEERFVDRLGGAYEHATAKARVIYYLSQYYR